MKPNSKGQEMTVGMLIAELENFDPDTVVRLAQQPSWPFEYSIGQIVHVWDAEMEDDDEDYNEDEGWGIVYIGEGSQLGYLPGAVQDHLNW